MHIEKNQLHEKSICYKEIKFLFERTLKFFSKIDQIHTTKMFTAFIIFNVFYASTASNAY